MRLRGIGNFGTRRGMEIAARKMASLADSCKMSLPVLEMQYEEKTKGKPYKYKKGWLCGVRFAAKNDCQKWVDEKLKELARYENEVPDPELAEKEKGGAG